MSTLAEPGRHPRSGRKYLARELIPRPDPAAVHPGEFEPAMDTEAVLAAFEGK